ncbi:multiple sugar transport system substrate-binding protein [Halanaerobium saccharolyticum]|uniref:Multiple sugar transport system substrate-binding protein n=1 Tax=Halanaerobium saccharolyticum TaxID=43595 RepID=A0A4R7YW82_9FIRM|nr:extracellular solute-binding protein [Halanaerobium saccharolyticum]RAK06897.1 multiple sugar transport system substrate-binding protein [Halanaerobium saccharolyticum]TDW01507.1 multiple sugar transport system substrate-binding protein [Halanaerobium saccharolyticum]TDX52868.1 multiple sugar transport system substrate-binding protein [Halanaerobium saccharolyticum]
MKKKSFVLWVTISLVLMFSISVMAQTTISVAWWGSQDRHNRTLEVIEMFEEEYPDINVEPEFLGFDGYWEKMAAQAAGRNLPDVMQHGYGLIPQYIEADLLLDLAPYVESGEISREYIDDTIVYQNNGSESMYGVNLGYNAIGLVYDPAMLEEAGVEDFEPGYTYQDLMEKSRKIANNTDFYAKSSYLLLDNIDGFCTFLRQNGTDLYYGEDFASKTFQEIEEIGYDDDQLFVKFHEMELEMVEAGAFAPIDRSSEVTNVEEDLLASGEAAMSAIWSNQLVAMERAADRPLNLTILPKYKDQVAEGLFLQPSQYFSVASNSENPDAAVKFINFFVDNVEANKVLMGERGVPASAKVRDALIPLLDDTTAKTFDYIDLAVEHSGPIAPPYPEVHNQTMQEYDNLREMMFYGLITPEEAARQFRQKVNQILANR